MYPSLCLCSHFFLFRSSLYSLYICCKTKDDKVVYSSVWFIDKGLNGNMVKQTKPARKPGRWDALNERMAINSSADVCVPALSSACMNFTAEAAIIRCVQRWWLEEFFFFLFSPPTEETFAGSLWSKISVWNHKNLFLFMSVWYKQQYDKAHTHTELLKKTVCLWCSMLRVWDWGLARGSALFSA